MLVISLHKFSGELVCAVLLPYMIQLQLFLKSENPIGWICFGFSTLLPGTKWSSSWATGVYTVPAFSADFTWSPFSKCSIQSLLRSVSPALWCSGCTFSCKKASANAELSARPRGLLRQRGCGSRGTVPNHGGELVCARGFAQVTGSGVAGSGCSQAAQAAHSGGVSITRGEGTCSGCFCTRSCW